MSDEKDTEWAGKYTSAQVSAFCNSKWKENKVKTSK